MKKFYLILICCFGTQLLFAQTSGGPDAYGYTWKNSNHITNPPSYTWVDITSKGNEITNLADDNVVGPYSVPPGFQFYWYPITQFWVGSNGYISFNGDNIASPFPASIPSSSGANDFLAMHLSDLNFLGTSNPAECWYYVTNDSLVVSYIDVPYWNVSSGFSGSNTFQVIFSSLDSSITFNYQSMNAGSTTLPIDNAVGMENNTGALGLQCMIDNVPGNNFTIKFYYPPVVTYAVTDCGVNWNNNEADGGYFIPVSNTPITLKSNIKNFGNQPIGSFTVTDSVYLSGTSLSNGSASISGLSPGQDTTIQFSNNFFAQFAARYTLATRVQGVSGDIVPSNNRKTQKIISVNTNQNQYTLDYSDTGPEGAALSWQGGNGGIGVYIEPPVYPIKIVGSQFHIASNSTTSPTGFSAIIYDDDGPNGAPGTVLDSVYVTASSINTGSYNTVMAQDTSIYIQNGGVYLVWYMGGPDISLSRDLTPPSSTRSLELLGGVWADYRDRLTEDFLMGLVVADAPLPKARFKADTTQAPLISFTDQSTKSPTSWHWDFGYNNDTSNVQNPTYTYPANGTYTVCLWVANSFGSDSLCKEVTIRNIDLDEFSADYQPFIYPNPSNGKTYIDLPPNMDPARLHLHITTITGQKTGIEYAVTGGRFEFSTADLSAGVYLFQVIDQDKNQTLAQGKFMIGK